MRRVRPVSSTMLAALAWAGACGTPSRPSPLPSAKFPERLPQIVLPMRDPIDEPQLAVEATLEGAGGRRKTLWMQLDTGATVSTVPAELLEELQLTPIGMASLDTFNGPVDIRMALLPRLFLGALMVEQLPVGCLTLPARGRDQGLVGNSVLDQAPWEISWDRGTVTLNATPWTEGGDVWSVPLVGDGGGRDAIYVRINGVTFKMMVDTGAVFSTIPRSLAGRVGIPVAALEAKGLYGATGMLPAGRRIFVADLEIGSRRLAAQPFIATDNEKIGKIGLPVLSSYELQVFPGRRLLFRPRNPDMRATAAARVRRWPWMPPCRSVGCIRGYVEGAGDGGRIVFEIEASLPLPASIVLGCAEAKDPDWLLPSELRGEPRPPYRHARLEIEGPHEALTHWIQNVDELLALPNGQHCRELTVLDVVPLRQTEPSLKKARLSLLP